MKYTKQENHQNIISICLLSLKSIILWLIYSVMQIYRSLLRQLGLLLLTFLLIGTSYGAKEDSILLTIEQRLNLKIESNQVHSKEFRKELQSYIELSTQLFHLEKALKLLQKLPAEDNKWNEYEKGTIYLYKGIITKYQENFTLSTYCFLNARDHIYKSKDKKLLFIYYLEKSEFDRKLGNLIAAYQEIHTTYAIFKKLKNVEPKYTNKLYNRLAAIANECSKHRESIQHSKNAIEVALKNNMHNELGISYNEIGFAYKNLHLNDSAEHYYMLSADEFLLCNNYIDYIGAKFNQGSLYFHNNYKRKLACQIFENIVTMVNEKKLSYSLITVYQVLMNEAKLNDDLRTQLKYWELFHEESLKYMAAREKSAILAVEKSYQDNKLILEKDRFKRNLKSSNENLKNTRRINLLMSATVIFLIIIIGLAIYFGYKMRKLNRQLVVQDSFNKRMMAVISHDLKGSMYLLSVLGKRVLNQNPERKDETVLRLNNQIQTSNEILDSLLKWLKSSISKTKQATKSSINAVWEIVHREFQEKVNEKGIEIIFEIEPHATIELPADVLRIAMRNLISNGIKYSYDRSSIFVRIRPNFFQVQDFGTGIESSRITQLFESDVISINGTLEESGFGIGLYMTNNMLQEHGFKIHITSVLDEGTTITISK